MTHCCSPTQSFYHPNILFNTKSGIPLTSYNTSGHAQTVTLSCESQQRKWKNLVLRQQHAFIFSVGVKHHDFILSFQARRKIWGQGICTSLLLLNRLTNQGSDADYNHQICSVPTWFESLPPGLFIPQYLLTYFCMEKNRKKANGFKQMKPVIIVEYIRF